MGMEFCRVLEMLPGMAFIALPDGCIDFMNVKIAEFTDSNYRKTGFLSWTATADPENLARLIENWQARLLAGEPFEMELPIRRSNREQGPLAPAYGSHSEAINPGIGNLNAIDGEYFGRSS